MTKKEFILTNVGKWSSFEFNWTITFHSKIP